MAKKISGAKTSDVPRPRERERVAQPGEGRAARPSSLLDTRVVYCGDNLEQLAKLPDACVDSSAKNTKSSSRSLSAKFWMRKLRGNWRE